jgi:prepilin-type processing-associated H-X9-DG protein
MRAEFPRSGSALQWFLGLMVVGMFHYAAHHLGPWGVALVAAFAIVTGRGLARDLFAREFQTMIHQRHKRTLLNFGANPEDPALNGPGLTCTIPFFLCPSDSAKVLQTNTVNGVIVNSAVHNYPLCTGTTYPLSPRNPGKVPITGVFYENSKTRFAELTDGASTTVCVSETVTADLGGPTTWDGVSKTNGFVLTKGNDNATTGPELTDYATQCSGAGLLLQQTRGSRWVYGAPGHSMYNHIRGPNDPGVDCRGGLPHSTRNAFVWDRLSHNVTAHSRHVGGVHALFCDGHVQFISDSVNLATRQALGTRGGNDTPGEF